MPQTEAYETTPVHSTPEQEQQMQQSSEFFQQEDNYSQTLDQQQAIKPPTKISTESFGETEPMQDQSGSEQSEIMEE